MNTEGGGNSQAVADEPKADGFVKAKLTVTVVTIRLQMAATAYRCHTDIIILTIWLHG